MSAPAPVYRPTAESIRLQLVDLGDGLQAQLHELSMRPDADRAEILARNLDGALRVCMAFREALTREGGSGAHE